MTVAPLGDVDAPFDHSISPASGSQFADTLARAFEQTSASLARADRAEHAYAEHGGSLQEMILERAQADVALSVASAAASRVAQGVSTLLGMAL